MMRRKLIPVLLALGLLGGTAVPANTAVVQDEPQEEGKPTQECIGSCNSDFPGGDPFTVAIRGWCYIIRCMLL
ncbi:MAG: hypothetical protein HY702_04085 [Gemmatimonadetes bacterium]|nr:hypothetical protein [Gemmatimonadota bacterium]